MKSIFFTRDQKGRISAPGYVASTAFQISGAVNFDPKPSEFEPTFSDPAHEFDTRDGDRGVSEQLYAKQIMPASSACVAVRADTARLYAMTFLDLVGIALDYRQYACDVSAPGVVGLRDDAV